MGDTSFKDAEAWLAERGIERDPIRVDPTPARDEPAPAMPVAAPVVSATPQPRPPAGDRTPVSAREAALLATEAPAPTPERDEEAVGGPGNLEDEVRKAVAYAQRATMNTPMTEGRLRGKLESRDYPAVVIDLAMDRCRQHRIVDDVAFAVAFVEERRRKGHAPARIRDDMWSRGFERTTIDAALADSAAEDPEAQAFAVARERIERMGELESEKAFRRLAGFLARRGYSDHLARKVAREVVYAAREQRAIAER